MLHAQHTKVLNAVLSIVSLILPQGLWAQEADDFLGFLLISAPRSSKISYVKLPKNGDFRGLQPVDLVTTGLHHPQGIAVDHKRKRLFVADPDVQKVVAYQLQVKGDQLSIDSRQTVISEGLESRWVAVDGLGNVFFSDEPESKIYKITMSKILRGNTDAEVMYDGQTLTQVNRPGGVAVDNFHIFWTNKHFGTQSGTVVKGAEVLREGGTNVQSESISILAQNAPKSYGVCLALNNVFFTDSDERLYAVKKTGGEVYQVSSVFKNPRGCVWDGDGTVFVADRGNNAVYAFAGNMHRLTTADVAKAFDVEDAFGLAFMAAAARLRSWLPFVSCIMATFASISLDF
jgi:sugar lactone lactonase YvrE